MPSVLPSRAKTEKSGHDQHTMQKATTHKRGIGITKEHGLEIAYRKVQQGDGGVMIARTYGKTAVKDVRDVLRQESPLLACVSSLSAHQRDSQEE